MGLKQYLLLTVLESLDNFEENWQNENEVLNLLIEDINSINKNDTAYNTNRNIIEELELNKALSILPRSSELYQYYICEPSNSYIDNSFGGFNFQEKLIYLNLYKFINFNTELLVSNFEELIKIINYLILHRPTLNAAIHYEIKHYLFAKGFKDMSDYKQQEEKDYLKYKDSSKEELESLLSELYAVWKQTQGTGFGEFTEGGLKLFFDSFNPSEEPYVVNLKSI